MPIRSHSREEVGADESGPSGFSAWMLGSRTGARRARCRTAVPGDGRAVGARRARLHARVSAGASPSTTTCPLAERPRSGQVRSRADRQLRARGALLLVLRSRASGASSGDIAPRRDDPADRAPPLLTRQRHSPRIARLSPATSRTRGMGGCTSPPSSSRSAGRSRLRRLLGTRPVSKEDLGRPLSATTRDGAAHRPGGKTHHLDVPVRAQYLVAHGTNL